MLNELVNNVLLNFAIWLWFGAVAVLMIAARGNRRRALLAVLFLVLFWISGTGPFARLVMRPLETKYSPPPVATLQSANVKKVVVLTGGGYQQTSDLAAGALPHASTFRYLAGLELCAHLGPDCEIIFSGSAGEGNTEIKTSSTMTQLTQTLVPAMRVESESSSNSTREHPGNVKPFVGDAPFALVTSAYHMPRAMLVFDYAGLHAIPFPVDYYTADEWQWDDYLPSPNNWEAINIALHEYVGIVLYRTEESGD